ncbi:unnamed protein product [Strongylus vulgaris]|uniref:Uncharacterized protein n=1 Tax=Strongylus vulgaris TaxID=40348 RepID=A0A3P7KF51_STRVU|nr:unnamed protein product [Strongylus vulgaris]
MYQRAKDQNDPFRTGLPPNTLSPVNVENPPLCKKAVAPQLVGGDAEKKGKQRNLMKNVVVWFATFFVD